MTSHADFTTRIALLRDLVDRLRQSGSTIEQRQADFIGWGNPTAPILIIGCELNVDTGKKKVEDALAQNIDRWSTRLVKDDFSPYWEDAININGNSSRGDSAPTWKAYQRLKDLAKGKNTSNFKNLDFYKDFFVTEISSQPSPRIRDYFQFELHKGISQRIENILSDDFFQKFKAVIMACGHYANFYNITQCFGELIEMHPRKDVYSEKQKKPHQQEDNGKMKSTNYFYKFKTEKQLILLTRQLSNGYSIDLLKHLAEEIRPYVEQEKL